MRQEHNHHPTNNFIYPQTWLGSIRSLAYNIQTIAYLQVLSFKYLYTESDIKIVLLYPLYFTSRINWIGSLKWTNNTSAILCRYTGDASTRMKNSDVHKELKTLVEEFYRSMCYKYEMIRRKHTAQLKEVIRRNKGR